VTKVKDKQTEHHRISNHSPDVPLRNCSLTLPECVTCMFLFTAEGMITASTHCNDPWRTDYTKISSEWAFVANSGHYDMQQRQ